MGRYSVRREEVAFVDSVESDEEESKPKNSEVNVVELKLEPPYVCTLLKLVKEKGKANRSKSYSFLKLNKSLMLY